MKKQIILSSIVALSLTSVSAFAVSMPSPAWYLKALGGFSFTKDFDLNVAGNATSPEEKLNTKTGYGIGISGGYEFANGLAVEGEIAHFRNSVDNLSGGDVPASLDASGRISATVFMLNGLFYFHNSSSFVPYIGVGIGAANINHDWDFTFAGTSVNVSGKDTDFAYQGIVGINYIINSNWAVGVDYRYLAAKKQNFDVTTNTGANVSLEEEYATNTILVGVTYHFV